MNKILILTLAMFLSFAACNCEAKTYVPHQFSAKQQKEFDQKLDDRLHFTDEQKELIKKNRESYQKDVKKNMSKMSDLHKKIKNVYLLGLPKYQTDIRTAGYKAELAIISQEVSKRRKEYRKSFLEILTEEQKAEYELMKKEMIQKRKEMMPLKRPPRPVSP